MKMLSYTMSHNGNKHGDRGRMEQRNMRGRVGKKNCILGSTQFQKTKTKRRGEERNERGVEGRGILPEIQNKYYILGATRPIPNNVYHLMNISTVYLSLH